MAVRRSKRKAAEEENTVNAFLRGESLQEDTPADTTMEEAPADDEAGPPGNKKPRKDSAEAAAKAADVEPPTPMTTEEEIAKTMVQAAVDAPIPVDEAEVTAPAEAATATEATATDPVKMEEGQEPNKPAAEGDPEAAEKPAVATTTETETPTEDAVKQEETAAPANSITAEAVAAMTGVAVPMLIYKKETEEYEEPDDGAEIPEETDIVWNAKLLDLLLYKAQYRTLHVQATYDAPLHNWVDIQRRLYRRQRKDPKSVSLVTQTRLTALDAINFPFTLRGSAHWDRYFSKLQEFKTKHGHCLVPRLCEFAGLGDWVIDQRRQYKLMMQGKPSVLDPERQRKLEDLGFVWVVRNRPEWNNRYQELLQYREKYGDTKVPQHYKEISGLGKWVAKQREQYRLMSNGKHSFLTPDRLEKLNEAGFVWSVRKDSPEEVKAEGGKVKGESSPSIPVEKEEILEEKPKEGDVEEVVAPAKEGESDPPAKDGEAVAEDKADEMPPPQKENTTTSAEATDDGSQQEKKEETKQAEESVAV